MPGSTTIRALMGAAALTFAFGVPAFAETLVPGHAKLHRHHVARLHAHRHFAGPPIIDVAGPPGVPLDERGAERYPNNGGEDELGPENGVAVGRESPVPGPQSTGLGLPETQSGPSFEIEGPPIGPSLPVLPYYVDPSFYR